MGLWVLIGVRTTVRAPGLRRRFSAFGIASFGAIGRRGSLEVCLGSHERCSMHAFGIFGVR